MSDVAEPICADCEPTDGGGFICDPERANCPRGDEVSEPAWVVIQCGPATESEAS